MPRGFSFPRVNRGDQIFCVEWKKEQPRLAAFEVLSSAHSSIRVQTEKGQERILIGKETLSTFGTTAEEAVTKEFNRIAFLVVKHGADPLKSLRQSQSLAALLDQRGSAPKRRST